MSSGSYEVTLDGKNRVVIPSSVREISGSVLYVLPGDRKDTLTIFPQQKFDELRRTERPVHLLSKEAREVRRFLAMLTFKVEIDNQGRVLLPERLLKLSGLSKEMLLVAMGGYYELWNRSGADDLVTRLRDDDYEDRMDRTFREIYPGAESNGSVRGA